MEISENILFKGINSKDCIRMIECFNAITKKYPAGSYIPDYTEKSDKIGIIIKGNAVLLKYDINGNRTILEKLEKNCIFGEFFNISKSHYNNINVFCETECVIMFIQYSEITKRCSNACPCHTMVVENLLELISKKAISLSERVEVLSQRTTTDKLMSYLNIIEKDNKTHSEIPFTTTALSDYLCVNRSALQREISKLKQDGVLEINKRKFRIIK